MRRKSYIIWGGIVVITLYIIVNSLIVDTKEDIFSEKKTINKIIDASAYINKEGIHETNDALDGTSIGKFEENAWIQYNDIDFGEGEAKVFMIVAAPQEKTRLELRIDSLNGEIIGSLEMIDQDCGTYFKEYYMPIKTIRGVHDLYICSKDASDVSIDIFALSSYSGNETQEEKNNRMDWWRKAKYGEFIHFGAYANYPFGENWQADGERGYGEWVMYNEALSSSEYEKLCVKTFNPSKFDAEKIVQDAFEAGMRYIVFTAKHHEGFSMYDTNVEGFAPFDIMDYGNYKGEDPVLALSRECKSRGMKFGCYYSIIDWHHEEQSDFGETIYDKEAYIEGMKSQLRELIQKYDVDILWFDGEWVEWWEEEDGKELYRYLRTLKPSIIINNRIGKRLETDGDFGTPEQIVPLNSDDFAWESCITMNNSWGYVPEDEDWKSPEWIISSLVSTVSRGGNILLNVGPDDEGVVPEQCLENLKEAGEWLRSYGDSIFNTTASPFTKELSFGAATKKEGVLFLHILKYPRSREIVIPEIKNEVSSVTIMGENDELHYYDDDGSIIIELPPDSQRLYDTVIQVKVEGIPAEK